MNKTLASLILAAFATVSLSAFAGSHAGGAPMADKAASAPKKAEAKKEMKKEEKKEAKKEEAKK